MKTFGNVFLLRLFVQNLRKLNCHSFSSRSILCLRTYPVVRHIPFRITGLDLLLNLYKRKTYFWMLRDFSTLSQEKPRCVQNPFATENLQEAPNELVLIESPTSFDFAS